MNLLPFVAPSCGCMVSVDDVQGALVTLARGDCLETALAVGLVLDAPSRWALVTALAGKMDAAGVCGEGATRWCSCCQEA
jgi:hypothetical protein